MEQDKIEREQEEAERIAAKENFLKKRAKFGGERPVLNLTAFDDESFWDSTPSGKWAIQIYLTPYRSLRG